MRVKMKIMYNGQLINEHSDEGSGGWSNPLETIPQVGSIINYMTFDEPHYKCGEGVTTSYRVKEIEYFTRETMNSSFKNLAVVIHVEMIGIISQTIVDSVS